VILGSLLLVTTLAPLGAAHNRERVDVDVRADADLEVHAAARSSARYSYAWDWGDGGVSAGAEARHAYASAGRYDVMLRVTDERTGDCWTERRTVRVEPTVQADDDEESDGGVSAEASIGAPRGFVDVGASLGRAHERPAPAPRTHAQGSAETYVESSGVRTVPGPGAAVLLPGLGAGALLLRRR
jgi:hypothetical protein